MKLILAPMAGTTDRAMRLLCRRYGADLCVSEMVSAKAMSFGDAKTAELAYIAEDDRPLSIQIFGSEPLIMAQSAYALATNNYKHNESQFLPAAIDINMGCPVKKIVSNGEGSALMKNPALCGEIVREVAKALDGTGIPVTVKIRAGFSADTINAVEVAKATEAAGAAEIAVHGRTREQMYMPGVNREVIAAVKRAVSVPVIANGDIDSGESALSMIRDTGCDALMIGRAALGNPFLFREIQAALAAGDASAAEAVRPTLAERLEVAAEHASLLVKFKGQRGILEARKHMSWYMKGIHGSAKARAEVNSAESLDEILAILRSVMQE